MTVSQRVAAKLAVRRRRSSGFRAEDGSDEGRGRTALVTGASAGIGRSLAELLAAKSYDVVVVARREDRLKELQAQVEGRWPGRIHVLAADLRQEDASLRIVDELTARGLEIDFLVNNAGYALAGPYVDTDWDDQVAFIRVMAVGVAELCRYLVPPMIERRWGRVINVSSVAGAMSGSPSMVLYSATKAFVNKFSEGLAAECEPHGVYVTASLPGATDTEIAIASGVDQWSEHHLLIQSTMMRPETVARQAYAACMAGRRLIVHGAPHKAWVFALLHSPPAVRYRLAGGLRALEYQRQS